MWYLITWTTYGYWLPGDPRGFRTRGHREHVAPPPRYAANGDSYNPDFYKPLFESARKRAGKTVALSAQHLPIVADVLKTTIKQVIKRPSIAAIGNHHVHVLVEPIDIDVPEFCRLAKGRSSTAVRKSGLGEMKWARGYHARSMESDKEARAAWRYISKHGHHGGLVRRIDPVE